MNTAEAGTVSTLPGIDTASLGDWLAELGIEYVAPITWCRIGGGLSNLTYLLTDGGGQRWVLRRPPIGTLLESAHDVVREARIIAALRDTAVPVPHLRGVAPAGSRCESAMVLMDYIDGQVIDTEEVVEQLPPVGPQRLTASVVDALSTIHAVPVQDVGLSTLASHHPYAARQLKRWSGQWQNSKTREVPLIDDLARRLGAGVPDQHEVTLVHGDFHLKNILVSRSDQSVVGVLDWELATLGEPMADVGALLAYWPHSSIPTPWTTPPTLPEGLPTAAEIGQAYLERTHRAAELLHYWHAFALWKIAIICEGVRHRAEQEPANNTHGVPTVDAVDTLIHAAADAAARARI